MGKNEIRKVFTVRIGESKIKDLKLLSIDTDKSIGDLLEEAIGDLIIKYGRSAVYPASGFPVLPGSPGE